MKQRLILGDCLEKMAAIPDGSIDMILCDLPYGITQNKWDCELDLPSLWEQYLRIGKPSCIFALHACQPFTSKLVCSQLKLWRHEWVWIKNRGSNFANTVREPMKEHETIQIFSRGKWTYNKQMQERTGGGADRVAYDLNWQSKSSNYREFTPRLKKASAGKKDREGLGKFNSFKRSTEYETELRVPSSWQKFNVQVGIHPTQKPIPLAEYLIKTYTNEGDTVLDNCCGSGTTCLAAKNLDRGFIGIEKEQEYYDLAKKRLGLPDYSRFRKKKV